MTFLADRMNRISESETIAMAKRGRALKAEGKDVLSLSFGEPDFQTPDHIKNAAIQAIKDGHTFYTPVAGIPELREAISEKFKNENHLFYAPDQIVVSTGAKHAIMNVIMALINPGDEVIIPTPYWVSYADMVKFAEGTPIFIKGRVENDYKITPEQLEFAITSKTKLFMFSSPCNPSGSVYTKNELDSFANVFAKHPNIFILSDEIYEHINFISKHESIGNHPALTNRTITVNGVSKSFAMTGWRIGYIGAPKEIAYACEKLQSQFTSGANSIAQRAALAAITSSLAPTIEMRETFRKRRDLTFELITKINGIKCNKPDGAFYLFPDVSYYFGKSYNNHSINNSEDLAMYLLSEALVVTVQGTAFGAPEALRLSFAANDSMLITCIERIKIALEKLN